MLPFFARKSADVRAVDDPNVDGIFAPHKIFLRHHNRHFFVWRKQAELMLHRHFIAFSAEHFIFTVKFSFAFVCHILYSFHTTASGCSANARRTQLPLSWAILLSFSLA